MVYKQLTEFCYGNGKLAREEVKTLQNRGLEFLEITKNRVSQGNLPIIGLASEENDLVEIEAFAKNIRDNFEILVVLGTGGSSLCGHALVGFKQNPYICTPPRVIFMQNIDPQSFTNFFATANLQKTAFLTISKSGNSVETIAQFLVCLEKAKEAKIDVKKHFFSVAMPGENALRRISDSLGIKVYDHDPNVGGRFSILSLVGLMPGLVAGIDARKLRKGAQKFLNEYSDVATESAAIHVALMRKNIWQNVLMTYPDNLEDYNIWYRQIWAESLGKNGTGSTPIKSMGTIDQHSQMQLYLGGRKDKFYNFITLKTADKQFKIGKTTEAELNYLNGKSLGDLINAEQIATIDTLVSNNRPVRVIELEKLEDEELGMLIMHLMLETILTAELLGVNPYDQPAVEEGKIKTKKLMAG